MLSVVAIFGVLIILVCAFGSANPRPLLGVVSRMATPAGLAVAALARLVLGVAAILAAPDSRAPLFLYVIGSIALLAAAALPIMGVAGFRRIVGWVTSLGMAWIRLWLLFGLIFGAALVWVSGLVP